MTEDEAVAVANDYIAQRLGPNPKFGGEPYSPQLLGIKRDKDNNWTVLYTIIMRESPGDVVDGPIIVVVNSISGEARFFNELYSNPA